MKKRVKLLGALILIVLAGLVAAWLYYDEEHLVLDASVRTETGAGFVQLPNGVVHYEIGGPDDGDPVVLVHGFSVPSYIWDPTFEMLAAEGYRVLRFDLFGRGYSDRPEADYTMDFFARQINDLTRELGFAVPFSLVGLSMGGAISTTYTNHHPDKVDRLILVDPLVVDTSAEEIFPLDVPLLGTYLAAVYFIPQIASGQTSDFHRPENFTDWEDKFRVQMQYAGYRRAIHATVLGLTRTDLAAEYTALGDSGKPVHVFWGRQDTTLPLEHSAILQDRVPQAELTVIEQAGHLPHYERPEVFNPLLLEQLRY